MDAPERAKHPLLSRIMNYVLGAWLLLFALPMFGAFIGYLYIPSSEWMALSRTAAVVGGAFGAALMLWVIATSPHSINYAYGDPKTALFTIITPFLGFAMGYIVVMMGAPMVGALVAGGHVERIYTVASTDRSKKCWNSIELIEAPYPADQLCGYSSKLRDSLWPRDRVAISGRGWQWGVIASDVRRID
ncbi:MULTISPECIES: hypothetical protein [unclassified Ensifer]|uniref:hypothetical protein n=1 Tax=unclassified Ensifer TaxID=2633371 RepID=UPI0008136AF7|nr:MULTISPECIES: hypothetical protein [unclassified Ensifer]OCP01836.1 hypothetical protein BC362_21775 [Ensifer sp. LC14]OCP04574.1 hypothetical protein BBX50_25120 [Ensifer sp. LC11]OCP09625.1 hypothetical protein BC374_03515 [Ensifer sp. LC13]OCP30672.1 hypothetical protein BC364_24805 [Ensifer sp. LC499]